MPTARIVLHLTERCGRRCVHCFREPDPVVRDLPVSLVGRILDQAKQVYGIAHVGLTGGEPTLHPQLPQVLDAIVARGMSWNVTTNGDRFRNLIALLEGDPGRRNALTQVSISLDGADEATHDGLRGPGSFREATTAAELCARARLPFSIRMTVNARNVGQIEEVGLAAARLGAARVLYGATFPAGSSRDDELLLPVSDLMRVRDRVLALRDLLRIPVGLNEGFPLDQFFHTCGALASETLNVDPRGRLTLCCMLSGLPGDDREVVADLAEVPLAEAHRRLLSLVHRFQEDKVGTIESGDMGEWDRSPCNYCLRYFGKPHWAGTGAGGPSARRAESRPAHSVSALEAPFGRE